jgi:hypothetical protein
LSGFPPSTARTGLWPARPRIREPGTRE